LQDFSFKFKNRYHLIYLILTIFILLLPVSSMLYPSLNWDILGYVASVKNLEGHNDEEIHRYVFDNLKTIASDEEYIELTSGGSYRDTMFLDSNAFAQQVPFYKIRILYNFLILFLSKLGLNPFRATYVISAISGLIALLIVYISFKVFIPVHLLIITPILILFSGVGDVSRLSTPDALAFLFMSLSFYLFLKKKDRLLVVLLPFSLLVRTDLIIFNALILFIMFLKNRKIENIISFVASLSILFAINHLCGNYGWKTVFFFTFIQSVPNPADITVKLTVKDYLVVLLNGLTEVKHSGFMFYISCLLLTLWSIFKNRFEKCNNTRLHLVLLISFCYVLFHFLLFPVLWTRFFVAPYLWTSLIFLVFFSRERKALPQITL